MYKDKKNVQKDKKEYVGLEKISKNDVLNFRWKWSARCTTKWKSTGKSSHTPTRTIRRSFRTPKPIQCFSSLYYLLLIKCSEPECHNEALQVKNRTKWEYAMDKEMQSLLSNMTWDLILHLRKKRHWITSGSTSWSKNMMAVSDTRSS